MLRISKDANKAQAEQIYSEQQKWQNANRKLTTTKVQLVLYHTQSHRYKLTHRNKWRWGVKEGERERGRDITVYYLQYETDW